MIHFVIAFYIPVSVWFHLIVRNNTAQKEDRSTTREGKTSACCSPVCAGVMVLLLTCCSPVCAVVMVLPFTVSHTRFFLI